METRSRPKLNQPCPCGSGKKYRECCAQRDERRRKDVRRSKQILKWAGGLAALALIIYLVSQASGVPFDEDAIGVVDFSALSGPQKRIALQTANGARCTCGCGMTLAQCVATDSTCPVRSDNIDRIKDMVAKAKVSS